MKREAAAWWRDGLGIAALVFCGFAAGCGGRGATSPTPSTPPVTVPPASPAPTVPAPPSAPAVFVGAGDIAMCDEHSEATARLLDTIGGTVFTLGDNVYFSGTAEEFRNCYTPTWGRHLSRTRPVPGNHEYVSPGAGPYFDYFGANAGPYGLGYYSFPVGTWHAITLNSNVAVDASSPQVQWLRADLAANNAPCTVAYWHHPLFTSGPNGDQVRMRDIWRILYDAGADVVLNGHDHMYERFSPQDPDGVPDATRGIRQFTVGTGGAFLYGPTTVHANSEVRLVTFGVQKLTLRSDGYDWQFIPVSGPGDSGTTSCH